MLFPVKEAKLPMVSDLPEADVKVPSTSSEARTLLKSALLSIVTLIPEGIIIASVVIEKGGAFPPAQVAVLLQLPDAEAVYVVAKAGRLNITAISISAVFMRVKFKRVKVLIGTN